MNDIILNQLKKYKCQTTKDYKNALKEIIQELALLALWRAKFFEIAAFYGGSALRILFKMNRFSEDLDFSLLKPSPNFDLEKYKHAIEKELESFGFKVTFSVKKKTTQTAVESGFLKANSLEHFVYFDLPQNDKKKLHIDEILKIKLEVDTDPPPNFSTNVEYLLNPIPFSVRVFAKEDLFAGKLHAIICRAWKNNVKGRDWYDLVWFVANNIPVNLKHLEMRMRQTSHWKQRKKMDQENLKKMLIEKINNLDINLAKRDVLPFINDSLEIWSKDFFISLVEKIEVKN